MISIALPWPPSTNHMYARNRNGGVRLTKKAQDYVQMVRVIAPGHHAMGRLYVLLMVSEPDRRRRDLDNLQKVLLDSLTKAGVWADDSQIDDLRIVRLPYRIKGGRILVEVANIPEATVVGEAGEGL